MAEHDDDRNTNGVFYCPMCTNAYAAAQARDEHYAKVPWIRPWIRFDC